jgi:hypothetical protein
MQFLAITSLFAAAALAAPAPQSSGAATAQEPVTITDFWLRKHNDIIDSVDFTLEGADGTFSCVVGETASFPSKTVSCGGPENRQYSVILIAPKDPSVSDVDLAIYHQTGQASGLWNEAPAPATYCRAGGDGIDDRICSQIPDFYTVVLTPSGPFENA